MSRIEVTPASLLDMAERLRTTTVVARRARRALVSAGPEVTGSAELTAALSEHADAWEWCLERLNDELLSGARALADAARAYEQVERFVVAHTTDTGSGGSGPARVARITDGVVHNPAGSGHAPLVRP